MVQVDWRMDLDAGERASAVVDASDDGGDGADADGGQLRLLLQPWRQPVVRYVIGPNDD